MCPETIYLHATPLDRARAMIGTRFRLHGRDPESGLDCVGFIARVFAVDGVPTGYALRGGTQEGWAVLLDGFATRRNGGAQAGDIMLLHTGPVQFHLGLWSGTSLIHADAAMGRVIELPGWPRWPVLGVWISKGA